MGRKAPWMIDELPSRPKRSVLWGVFVWRGDNRYQLPDAIRAYKRRADADRYAEKDETGTWVVRSVDAPLP